LNKNYFSLILYLIAFKKNYCNLEDVLVPLLSLLPLLLHVNFTIFSVAALEVEGALRRSRLAAELAATRAATEVALRRSRVEV